MKKIRTYLLGIDQGNVEVFSEFDSGGEMWTGSGPRQRVKRVAFSQPFENAPSVMVGVSLWDMDASSVIRADVSAKNITKSSFEIVYKTWSDSKVARANVNWIAMGELKDEELWEL